MRKANNSKQFKNSTAYKIIVGVLLVLYIGFQIFGNHSDEAQDANVNTVEYSEEQWVESFAADLDEEASEEAETEAFNMTEEAETEGTEEYEQAVAMTYTFRSNKLWESHYDKHGIDMGFDDKEAYLAAANAVITNPDTLHKIEGEDGDDVYYLEATNEFVVVSTDGYLRTYFCPDDGIDYFNRQ